MKYYKNSFQQRPRREDFSGALINSENELRPMSILNPFSGGEDDGPDSPEEKVEVEEAQVISDLESLQNAIEDALKAEINLFEALESDMPENIVDERLGNIQIYLEEDVSPREETVESEIQKLRNHENNLQASKPLMEEHQQLLEIIQDAIEKTEDEVQRLEKIIQASENVLEGEDFSHDRMSEKIGNEITRDKEEANALEDELQRAESIESEIRQA